MCLKPHASTPSANEPYAHGSDRRTSSISSGLSGTRSRNTRWWLFNGRSAGRIASSAPRRVDTSVTYASMSAPAWARGTLTRWWPSRTKCRSPMRYTEIGGMSLPRRWAFAICSQRGRVRVDVGRKLRSNSRGRPTLPTIESSGIDCRPSERSPVRPSASTTSSNGRIRFTSEGSRRNRCASRASARWRRARVKSFCASFVGKPVSIGGAMPLTVPLRLLRGPDLRRLDVEALGGHLRGVLLREPERRVHVRRRRLERALDAHLRGHVAAGLRVPDEDAVDLAAADPEALAADDREHLLALRDDLLAW